MHHILNITSAAEGQHKLVRALDARHVAIFGASAKAGKWGYNAAARLLTGGYPGKITLVGLHAGEIFGQPIVDGKEASGADLAVICTPAGEVPGIIRECGERGIGVAVVVAGGFLDEGNHALDRTLRQSMADSGVRVIGPNCIGLYVGPNRLNVTTMPQLQPGTVSVVSQSGGVVQQLAVRLNQLGVGYDVVIALGNKADIGFSESIRAIRDRGTTSALLLYFERLDEGEELLDVVAQAAERMTVVALVGGKTRAGRQAAESHTGSMLSQWDRAAGLLCDAGAYAVRDLEHAAAALASGWRGKRRPISKVFVLCDGGGHSVLLSDALESAGFELAAPSRDLAVQLAKTIGLSQADRNPLDIQGRADRNPSLFVSMLQTILNQHEYDAVVLGGILGGYASQMDERLHELETAAVAEIGRISSDIGTPVIVQTSYATQAPSSLAELRKCNVPYVEWPSEVVDALRVRSQPSSPSSASLLSDSESGHGTVNPSLSQMTDRVLDAFEKRGIRHSLGNSVGQKDVSGREGDNWVLRLDGVVHKAKSRAIYLNVPGSRLPETYAALKELAASLNLPPRVRLGQFIQHDYEFILSFWRHPSEGNGWLIGGGGVNVEPHADITIARWPRGSDDVYKCLTRTAIGYYLLNASAPAARALVELVLKMKEVFFYELKDLRELECNPVAIAGTDAVVLDVLPVN